MQGCRRKNKIAALAHATYENPVWVELDRGVIPENEIIDEMVKVAPQYEADIRRFFKEGKAFVVKAFDYAAVEFPKVSLSSYSEAPVLVTTGRAFYLRLFLLSRKASNATIKLPKDISKANIPMKIVMIS